MSRVLALSLMLALCVPAAFAADEDAKAKEKPKADGAAVEKLFEKMDGDKDGKVSKAEFKKFFEGKGKGKVAEIADRLFEKIDADADGYVTKDEMKKLTGGLMERLGGADGLKDKIREKLKELRKKE